MKKRLIAVLLVMMMSVSVLSSCVPITKTPEVIVPIYTLYGITGDTTTPEAIRQVELALNRMLIPNYDVAVKLMLYKADEYDAAIDQAFKDMEAFEEQQKIDAAASKAAAASAGKKNVSEGSEPLKGFTGDQIIDKLESGEELTLDEPRIDIMLVQGKDEYYQLIADEKLTESGIADLLNSEAKAITKYVHPYFVSGSATDISAARVEGKIYGIPNNGAIGEYEYLVFDKELLEKYSFDAPSLKTLADVELFLEAVKANEPDVVPITGTTTPNDVSFLFQDGFPVAIDKNGYVFGTYLSDDMKAYYEMLNRFRQKGYLPDGVLDPNDRFAVTIIDGNLGDIADLEKKTGRKYEYTVYKNPIATADNMLKNIFCFSKYCTSTDLSGALKVLKLINTDIKARNIFQYGIENVNYKFDDNGQVDRQGNEDYIMNVEQTGNQFLCYTLAGQDPNIWENAKIQNKNATVSPFISFVYVRQEIKAATPDETSGTTSDASTADTAATDSAVSDTSDTSAPAAPDTSNEEEVKAELEPDYKTLYTDITNKYYDDLINGTGNFEEIWANIQAELAAAGDGYEIALRTSFEPQIKAANANYPEDATPYSYMKDPNAVDESGAATSGTTDTSTAATSVTQ